MRVFVSLLNKAIWLCGIFAISYVALLVMLGKEVKAIHKELQSNDQVKAYFFFWYEGQALSPEIWLTEKRYLKMDYVNIEDFFDTGAVLIRQIDSFSVSCSANIQEDEGSIYKNSNGLAVSDIPAMLQLEGSKISLHEIFKRYDQLKREVSTWPAPPPAGHKDADNPVGYYQNGDRVFQCWKIDNKAPEMPLTGDLQLKHGGHNFYRKPD